MNEIDIAFLVAVYSEVVVAASDLSLRNKLQEQIKFLNAYRNSEIEIRHSLFVEFPYSLKIDLYGKKELTEGAIKQLASNIEDLPRTVFEKRKDQCKTVSHKVLKNIERDLSLDSIEQVIDRLMRFHLHLMSKYDKKTKKVDIVTFAFLSKIINAKDEELRELEHYYSDHLDEDNFVFEGAAPYKVFTSEEFAEVLKKIPFYKSFSDGSEYFIYEEDDSMKINKKNNLKISVQDHVNNLNSKKDNLKSIELARMANLIFQTLYLKCDTTYRYSSYEAEFDYYLASIGVFSLEELIEFYEGLRIQLENVKVVISPEDVRIDSFYQNVDTVLKISNNKLPDINQIISYMNNLLVKDFIKNVMTKTRNNNINVGNLQKRCLFMTLNEVKDFKEQVLQALRKRGVKSHEDLNICENIKAAFEVIETQMELKKETDIYPLKLTVKPTQS